MQSNRRELLKTTGVGAGVALGMGTGSVQGDTTDSVGTSQDGSKSAVQVFDGTASEGFITINEDTADADPVSFVGPDLPDIEIEGVIYDNNTWESTRVDFPKLQPEDVLDDEDVPVVSPEDLDGDINIQVDPISGTFDASKGLVTGDISITLDVDLSAAGGIVEIDVSITTSSTLTSGTSGSMQGSVEGGLDGGSATATLVNNEFALEATGNGTVDDQFGLPSPAGRNFLQITLDVQISDIDDEPEGPVELTTFQTTSGSGYLSFDTGPAQEGASQPPDDEKYPFGAPSGGDIQVEGKIYSDETWESTQVTLPDIDVESLIVDKAKQEGYPDIVVDVLASDLTASMQVETPITGRYEPQPGVMTADLSVTISGEAELPLIPNIKADINVDATLTTGVSENMEGSVEGMATGSPSITVVANDYRIDETGNEVDTILGLPTPPGRNWAQLSLEMDVADTEALQKLVIDPVVDFPPKDPDKDGLYEDVIGSGAFNEIDPEKLFDNIDTAPVQDQTDLFTFAGGLDRTQVGVVDAQALYNGGVASNWTPGEMPAPPTVIQTIGDIDLSLRPDIEGSQIDEGETVPVDLVVEGADQIEAFDLAVALRDNTVATITGFSGQRAAKDASAIVDDGGRLELRGATLDSPYQSGDDGEITLATVEVKGEEPGAAVDLEVTVGSFPRGIFGADTGRYQVAESPTVTVPIDFPAEIGFQSQTAPGGDHIVVETVGPGDRGAFIGIWRTEDGTPVELLGRQAIDSSVSNTTVELDQTLSGNGTVLAAVHPAGDSGPDTTQILASDSATVELAPPQLDPEFPGPPKDLDGDGLYEAVRGNNELTILDVQTLFNRLDDPTLQNNAEFFKFQESGNTDEVTILDVQALFNRLDGS